ncbi:MAG: thioredoxin-dependent thiol peroxidase [Calditrichaeota bacterium]|nr:thioredoxin-dependent thiol peroxidase [Calditrichota bacterium]
MASDPKLSIGQKAPDFCLPDQNKEEVCLHNYRGKWVVLYFYPKDNTTGCTTEALDFTAHLDEFKAVNAEILGVSPDSPQSHLKFITKKDLKLRLLSDGTRSVLETYGVWQLKKMAGREYYGVVRSTFLIDPKGTIAYTWPKVKVKGHAEDVLRKIKSLQKL